MGLATELHSKVTKRMSPMADWSFGEFAMWRCYIGFSCQTYVGFSCQVAFFGNPVVLLCGSDFRPAVDRLTESLAGLGTPPGINPASSALPRSSLSAPSPRSMCYYSLLNQH